MALTAERVRELLDYNPETGEFAWTGKENINGKRAVDQKIGAKFSGGYQRVQLDGNDYLLHRVAWLHACGRWPRGNLDHENMVPADNRLDNLREATQSQNKANTAANSNNSTGVKGVYKDRRGGRYFAKIGYKYERIRLGSYDTKEEAAEAYAEAAKEFFGEFARV